MPSRRTGPSNTTPATPEPCAPPWPPVVAGGGPAPTGVAACPPATGVPAVGVPAAVDPSLEPFGRVITNAAVARPPTTMSAPQTTAAISSGRPGAGPGSTAGDVVTAGRATGE